MRIGGCGLGARLRLLPRNRFRRGLQAPHQLLDGVGLHVAIKQRFLGFLGHLVLVVERDSRGAARSRRAARSMASCPCRRPDSARDSAAGARARGRRATATGSRFSRSSVEHLQRGIGLGRVVRDAGRAAGADHASQLRREER